MITEMTLSPLMCCFRSQIRVSRGWTSASAGLSLRLMRLKKSAAVNEFVTQLIIVNGPDCSCCCESRADRCIKLLCWFVVPLLPGWFNLMLEATSLNEIKHTRTHARLQVVEAVVRCSWRFGCRDNTTLPRVHCSGLSCRGWRAAELKLGRQRPR